MARRGEQTQQTSMKSFDANPLTCSTSEDSQRQTYRMFFCVAFSLRIPIFPNETLRTSKEFRTESLYSIIQLVCPLDYTM